MLLTSLTKPDMDQFPFMTFNLDSMPSEFTPPLRSASSSFLDGIRMVTEDFHILSLLKLSSLMTLTTLVWLTEEVPTTFPESLEETTSSFLTPHSSSNLCGEPTSELRPPMSTLERDSLLDLDSTCMKPSTNLISTTLELSQATSSRE